MSGETVATRKANLADYDTSKGTIKFSARTIADFARVDTDATVAELAACANQINAALASDQLRGRIHSVLPLSRAAEAHALIERGGLFGKIVLVPDA
jgi:NADPH:quinone reductase-like Zn-dependent oxidoreductase